MIEQLIASNDAQTLQVHWKNGDISELSAETLRRQARDALPHLLRVRVAIAVARAI